MIDTFRLHDPIAQSGKLGGDVVVIDQAARHPRPNPPARISERRKAVESVELEPLPRRPCSTGRLIIRHEHDRPAGYRGISPPQHTQPVAGRSHFRSFDAIRVSRKMRGGSA
jgi:hypothetical protein